MEYLRRVLGINVEYENESLPSMPNYIYDRYHLKKVILDGYRAVFVYPNDELEAVNLVKKHLEKIEKVVGIPTVLMLDRLTYRGKMYLIRDKIPFVVEEKQIYLPFLAVYLQERNDGEKKEVTKILPSAQLLLLHFIYGGCHDLLTSDAADFLSVTATSISRASRQLEEIGLIKTEKRGVQKVISSAKAPKELFAEARNRLLNPVKRTIYVPLTALHDDLLLSGYSALAEYSTINPPTVECHAAASVANWERDSDRRLSNSDEQCAIELWRYDPKLLSDGESVDRLSLALALQDDRDERTEEAIEDMLNQVWRDIDGKRH